MSDIVIRVENLSKRYRIGLKEEMHDNLVGAIVDLVKRPVKNLQRLRKLSIFGKDSHEPEDIIWALKDVSFEVKRGEVIGIIGRNGAGKSTLLKILAHITEPTQGRAVVRGRVGSLLEVGTGFHPELTGRENVYLNGTILGMSKTEIDRKFDGIVAFSEVEKFLDTPVKRYSSGMKVRLAFAVAAHLEPEILVVDEVLAVGDAQFQKKCLGKMEEVGSEGRTVLFVSHNMGAIEALCRRAILLDNGRLVGQGAAREQVGKYLKTNRGLGLKSALALGDSIELTSLDVSPNPVESGSSLHFSLQLHAKRAVRIEKMALLFYTSLGMRVAIVDLRRPEGSYELTPDSTRTIRGTVHSLPLVEGEYSLGLFVSCRDVIDNFLDLKYLTVSWPEGVHKGLVPYPSRSYGVVNLEYSLH